MKSTIKKSTIIRFAIIVLLVVMACPLVLITDVHALCTTNVDCSAAYLSLSRNSPAIVISRDVFSSGSQVNIMIHAPDFNSSPYAIDTIGEEGSKVIISTREDSIQYKLVETGFDTGDFEGYVILSSTTSTCSSICGPTNGFLAASGDDAITVSLVYPDGSAISSRSSNSPSSLNHGLIPEFQFANIILLASMILLIFFPMIKKYGK